jgi:hypothetical protein
MLQLQGRAVIHMPAIYYLEFHNKDCAGLDKGLSRLVLD